MGLFQPAVGPSSGDLSAQLAAANARLKEQDKRAEWLQAKLHETAKDVAAIRDQVRELNGHG